MQVSILKGMAQCSSWIHGMAAKPSGFESFGQKARVLRLTILGLYLYRANFL